MNLDGRKESYLHYFVLYCNNLLQVRDSYLTTFAWTPPERARIMSVLASYTTSNERPQSRVQINPRDSLTMKMRLRTHEWAWVPDYLTVKWIRSRLTRHPMSSQQCLGRILQHSSTTLILLKGSRLSDQPWTNDRIRARCAQISDSWPFDISIYCRPECTSPHNGPQTDH